MPPVCLLGWPQSHYVGKQRIHTELGQGEKNNCASHSIRSSAPGRQHHEEHCSWGWWRGEWGSGGGGGGVSGHACKGGGFNCKLKCTLTAYGLLAFFTHPILHGIPESRSKVGQEELLLLSIT